MGRLVFVRHGETNKNIGNNLHATDDPETLNAIGKSQIDKTAKRLKVLNPFKIYTSKENRAVESAKLLSSSLKIPIQSIEGLQERNWGIYSNKPWSDVKSILDPMTFEERFHYVPSGGESWESFETRLKDAIEKITRDNTGNSVVVVTHGGAIRALIPCLLNAPREESFKYDPDNASITIFDFDDDGFHKVVVNDISHLTA